MHKMQNNDKRLKRTTVEKWKNKKIRKRKKKINGEKHTAKIKKNIRCFKLLEIYNIAHTITALPYIVKYHAIILENYKIYLFENGKMLFTNIYEISLSHGWCLSMVRLPHDH